ncbi:MAG: glycosyltransferase family 39 protein [Pseudomonadota bacterium]
MGRFVKTKYWIFLIYLWTGIITLFLIIHNPNMMGGDGVRYLVSVFNWFHGGSLSVNGKIELLYSPGYGFVANIINLLISDLELSGMVVSGLSFCGIVVLAYTGTKFYGGEKAGIIAAFLCSFFPLLLSQANTTLSDTLYTFLLLGSYLWFLYTLTTKSLGLTNAILGFLLGLACLVRPDTFIVLLALILFYSVNALFKLNNNVGEIASNTKKILILIGAFVSTVSSYVAYLYCQTNQVTISLKFSNKIYRALGLGEPPGNYYEGGDLTFAMKNFANGIDSMLLVFFKNILLFLNESVFQLFFAIWPLFCFFIIFLVLNKFKISSVALDANSKNLLLGLVLFSIPIVPIILDDPTGRYIMPYCVLFFVFISYETSRIMNYLFKIEASTKNFSFGIILFMSLSISAHVFPGLIISKNIPHVFNVFSERQGHLGLKTAGLWINKNMSDSHSISVISRKPGVVLFFAAGKRDYNGKAIGLPDKPEEICPIAYNEDIEYVVFDNYYTANMKNYKKYWDNPQLAYEIGLELIYQNKDIFQLYKISKMNEKGSSGK